MGLVDPRMSLMALQTNAKSLPVKLWVLILLQDVNK